MEMYIFYNKGRLEITTEKFLCLMKIETLIENMLKNQPLTKVKQSKHRYYNKTKRNSHQVMIDFNQKQTNNKYWQITLHFTK